MHKPDGTIKRGRGRPGHRACGGGGGGGSPNLTLNLLAAQGREPLASQLSKRKYR